MIPPPSIFYVVFWMASSLDGYEYRDYRAFRREDVDVACKHVVEYLPAARQKDIEIYAFDNDGKRIRGYAVNCEKFEDGYDAILVEKTQ